jgi:serine/threonine-protein kinase
MTTPAPEALAALIARLTAGEAVDLEAIAPELRARPEIARLLKLSRVMHQLDLNAGSGTPEPRADAGEQIGVWRLTRLLGAGGMGDVWLGERTDGTVEQRVAIKRVRGNLAHFAQQLESERRILARLSHPNIARFLDAGIDRHGAPWLALEFVDGEPITQWCDARRLGLSDRLRLFRKVCAAVEHAHRHLVVHRDLKPSNVLVDAEGEPKLLDFGIAKLLDGSAREHTAAALTPAYAAPEQLRGQEVSTATDVYALGLLLFRLLAGRLPETRSGDSPAAVLARLDDEETQRPSRHAARSESALPFAAAALEGDLDAIVAQALRAQPEARYGSVAEFSDDIARHLASQPVRAREATRWYRFSRFARRNRGALGIGLAAVLGLTLAAAVALWQAHRANEAAAAAASEAARADAAAGSATAQARRAKKATEFLMSVFLQSDPFRRDARGAITLDQAFEDALARIDTELGAEPVLQADLNDDFGEILATKGRFDEAQARFEKALGLAEAHHPPNSPAIGESLINLGLLQAYRGRELDGKPWVERAVQVFEQHADTEPLALGNARMALASIMQQEGKIAESLPLVESAAALYRAHLPAGDIRLPIVLFNLGMAYHGRGRYAEAAALFDEALPIAEGLHGKDSAGILPMLDGLIVNRDALEQYDEARTVAERALAIAAVAFPDAHPRHAEALIEAGFRRLHGGDAGGAELLHRGIAMYRELESEGELRGWRLLGVGLEGTAADAAIVAGVKRCAELERPRHPECLQLRALDAMRIARIGAGAQALALADAVLADAIARDPKGDATGVAHEARAEALIALGRRDEAITALRAAEALYRERYGETHRHTRGVQERITSELRPQ